MLENGNAPIVTKIVDGKETVIPPTSVEEKHKEGQTICEQFGGNTTTKKTHKNLLKQQYENFAASNTEVIEQTYERLQKQISQLEIHGEVIPQEDINQKFLRSLRDGFEVEHCYADYKGKKIPEEYWKEAAPGIKTAETWSLSEGLCQLRKLLQMPYCLSVMALAIELDDQAKEGPTNFALIAYSSTSSSSSTNFEVEKPRKQINLTDYKEIDGGFVAFGGNSKGGKITGKDATKQIYDSMNYKPVVTGNQSNGNAGTKACDDASKARMETVPGKDYILLPMWPADPLFSQNSKEISLMLIPTNIREEENKMLKSSE
ncbi:hypothetical protein Tco_0269679 [Tanacetum coccineum]